MTADNVMTATAAMAPAVAKSLRTRALATIKLSPATRRPAIRAASAVLVCVRTSMPPPTTTSDERGAAAHVAAEPEHDDQATPTAA